VFDARIVNQITRGKIIGAVKDDVAILNQPLDIRMISVDDLRFCNHIGIDFPNVSGAGYGFRQALSRVTLGEHRLPLQIRELNKVSIDDAQRSYARARQRFRLR
jgi:hypothetical protein